MRAAVTGATRQRLVLPTLLSLLLLPRRGAVSHRQISTSGKARRADRAICFCFGPRTRSSDDLPRREGVCKQDRTRRLAAPPKNTDKSSDLPCNQRPALSFKHVLSPHPRLKKIELVVGAALLRPRKLAGICGLLIVLFTPHPSPLTPLPYPLLPFPPPAYSTRPSRVTLRLLPSF